MIERPNIIKGLPTALVRPLPTIYYYGRYGSTAVSDEAQVRYRQNVDYLSTTTGLIASLLHHQEVAGVTSDISTLQSVEPAKVEDMIYEITRRLSRFCLEHKDAFKALLDGETGLKKRWLRLYAEKVQPTTTLLVDNASEPDWVDRLASTLSNSCHYDVMTSRVGGGTFSEHILRCDFVIFASATPQSIHTDVEYLNAYKKPGLILAPIKKDKKLDQQTVRNGAWLKSRGFDLLYKTFSPLRLFTTIDKIFIRFLLQPPTRLTGSTSVIETFRCGPD
jgi:hypothetical protein